MGFQGVAFCSLSPSLFFIKIPLLPGGRAASRYPIAVIDLLKFTGRPPSGTAGLNKFFEIKVTTGW